jgi:hypothetical protein
LMVPGKYASMKTHSRTSSGESPPTYLPVISGTPWTYWLW